MAKLRVTIGWITGMALVAVYGLGLWKAGQASAALQTRSVYADIKVTQGGSLSPASLNGLPIGNLPTRVERVTDGDITLLFSLPQRVTQADGAPDALESGGTITLLRVPVCQPVGDAPQRLYQSVKLVVADTEVASLGWAVSLDHIVVDDAGNPIYRCDTIDLPVREQLDLSSFKVVISDLRADVSEAPDCDSAQQTLDETNTGVTIQCYHGEYSFTYDTVARPDGMSEEEARAIVRNSMAPGTRGSWTYSSGIK